MKSRGAVPTKRRAIAKRAAASRPDFRFEQAHHAAGRLCVGVDEVGRGCLAGPVVAAAVQLPESWVAGGDAADRWWLELNDSKLVKPADRERLAELVHQNARVQIAWCTVEEIDRWNILRASLEAMRRALVAFKGAAGAVLVDGHIDPFSPRYAPPARPSFTHVEPIVKGDQRSLSIAAASIVAKVYRDRWMTELGTLYPTFGFDSHKGYGTPAHHEALARVGPCALHRKSFAPFKSGSELCSADPDGEETDWPEGE